MCFSATASYGTAAVLVATGLYAVRQAKRLPPPYWLWALVPAFFGFQQAFEGRVWQALDSGDANAAVFFALGFHFFSHFLWLWWFPLCSALVEPGKLRKRVFFGCAVFGALAGTLVYSVMLLHSEWLSVALRGHSIHYNFSAPWHSPIHLPVTAAMLYGLIILLPLLFSSHMKIRIFGGLIALSMALASEVFSAAYVSVWCFFAAVLSLYLVYMVRGVAAGSKPASI